MNKTFTTYINKVFVRLFALLAVVISIAAGKLPDRITLTWTDDPATTQTVTWRTDISVEKAVAQIAIAEDNGHHFKSKTIEAVSTYFDSEYGEVKYHQADFTGLLTNTLYAYRVGDEINWSEWFHFKTASTEPRPFSFIYFGDAQADIKTHWSRVFHEAFKEAPKAAFTLHAGDLINRAQNDEQWGEWFDAPGWVNASLPVIATPGNHEYFKRESEPDKPILSTFWRPQFSFPLNGPAEVAESCYYLDYQGARIISLNSNEHLEKQAEWLREVLKNNPQRWTFITFHHPVFSPKANRDNPELRELWKPIFDEFKVDMVLTGHDHRYARTISGETAYIVSVSGPKLYDIDRQDWMIRAGGQMQLYQIIKVDPWEIRYESYTVTGKLYDAFVIKKQEKGEKEILELHPPEQTEINIQIKK